MLDTKVREAYPWKRNSGQMIFEETGKAEGTANYVVCITASVTTPDSTTVRWVQPLYSLPKNDESKETFENEQPIKVLKRTRLGLS